MIVSAPSALISTQLFGRSFEINVFKSERAQRVILVFPIYDSHGRAQALASRFLRDRGFFLLTRFILWKPSQILRASSD